jgi:ferric-chelate reductase
MGVQLPRKSCRFISKLDLFRRLEVAIMPQFSSYATDPNYATAFTITWASAVALCALVAFPRLVRSARQGQLTAGLRGLGEDFEHKMYQPIADDFHEKELLYVDTLGSPRPVSTAGWGVRARGYAAALGTLTLYSPPYIGLDLGQSECLFAPRGAPSSNKHRHNS